MEMLKGLTSIFISIHVHKHKETTIFVKSDETGKGEKGCKRYVN